jgi:hypothetical protein
LSGFEVAPVIRTGGSFISRETETDGSLISIFHKSYTGGSLISQED